MSDTDLFDSDQELDMKLFEACNVVETSPVLTRVKPPRQPRPAKHCPEDYVVVRNDTEPSGDVKKVQDVPADISEKHRPYVYHDLKEVLSFTPDNMPENNQLHLLGTYKRNLRYGAFLSQVVSNQQLKIPLVFTGAKGLPALNQTVSLYGFVDFKQFGDTTLPLFDVAFWRQQNGDVERYTKNLKQLRCFIPAKYLNRTTFEYNDTYLDATMTIENFFQNTTDNSFQVINDSFVQNMTDSILAEMQEEM